MNICKGFKGVDKRGVLWEITDVFIDSKGIERCEVTFANGTKKILSSQRLIYIMKHNEKLISQINAIEFLNKEFECGGKKYKIVEIKHNNKFNYKLSAVKIEWSDGKTFVCLLRRAINGVDYKKVFNKSRMDSIIQINEREKIFPKGGFIRIPSCVNLPYKYTLRSYNVWENMLIRSNYRKDYVKYGSEKSYKECELDDSWKNFYNFNEWFSENYKDGYEVDKDIKTNNESYKAKYGPDTTTMIPSELNHIIVNKAKDDKYPCMVHKITNPRPKQIVSSVEVDGKKINCGYFDSVLEAFLTAKIVKEHIIRTKSKNFNISEDIIKHLETFVIYDKRENVSNKVYEKDIIAFISNELNITEKLSYNQLRDLFIENTPKLKNLIQKSNEIMNENSRP